MELFQHNSIMMTSDDLFSGTKQTAVETLTSQQVDINKLSDDDWYTYWSDRNVPRCISVQFHHHTWPADKYDKLFPKKDVQLFTDKLEQMMDNISSSCSDVRVINKSKDAKVIFDVMFQPGRPVDVIPFLIRLWRHCGQFSSTHYSPVVNFFARTNIDNLFKSIDCMRQMSASFYAVRHDTRDRGAIYDPSEEDCFRFTETLLSTGLYPEDTSFKDVATLVLEYIRKSLNLRKKETGEEYSPDWTSFHVKHILKMYLKKYEDISEKNYESR